MKNFFPFLIAATLVVVACKAKKAATTVTGPDNAQLTAVQAKMPATTMDDLKKGHDLYYGACTECHGVKNVKGYSEEKLQRIITKMSAKAKLTDDQKDAVWKYALAVNLTPAQQ